MQHKSSNSRKKTNRPMLILASILLIVGLFMMIFSSVNMILRADAAPKTVNKTIIVNKTHKP